MAEVLVDYSGADLPDDVESFGKAASKKRVQGGAASGGMMGLAGKGQAGDGKAVAQDEDVIALNRWDIKTHTYRIEAEGSVGFLTGLFSGTNKTVSAGVVHETKRYQMRRTATKRLVEFGASVRLLVATTDSDSELELTIPNLAARAQLGMSEARIAVSVVGYSGALGELLPSPENLNVENLSVFMQAAKAIQARVFGPSGAVHLAPTVLSYHEKEPTEPTKTTKTTRTRR